MHPELAIAPEFHLADGRSRRKLPQQQGDGAGMPWLPAQHTQGGHRFTPGLLLLRRADPRPGAIDIARFPALRRVPLGLGHGLPEAEIDQQLGRPELALQADVLHRQLGP